MQVQVHLTHWLYQLPQQSSSRAIPHFQLKRPFSRAPRNSTANTVVSMQSSVFVSSLPSDIQQEAIRRVTVSEAQSEAQDHGLLRIWPSLPPWLRNAPFPVAWEVVRIAQSCRVDLTSIHLVCSREWENQTNLRASLYNCPEFQGKAFPAASSDAAWAAGLRAAGIQHEQGSVLPSNQEVVFSASLDFSSRPSSPLQLTMQPLKLEESHRLARHFGADRFLELLLPSPDASNLPGSLKDGAFFDKLIDWLGKQHTFCGRSWTAFYTKSGGSRKPVKDLQFGPPKPVVFKDRIYFFAESAEADRRVPQTRLSSMLKWALEVDQKENGSQPVQKLFQRIALVLSRTTPAIVFEPKQMVHWKEDLRSPTTGVVMNDGVGRMSPAVARQIRASLGLTFTPSAVQGRLGSAKGMWILDTTIPSSSDEIRIETYPSQRKWKLNWSAAHEDHRTLEIRGFASLPKSASFNLQFLPVLADRAENEAFMREAVGSLLETNLKNELDGQKRALQSPLEFRQWVHENATHKHDRVTHGHVPFQGGMPQEDEEVMNVMLDAGFDPKSNKMLNKMTYEVQKRKCEMLMKKLNITVGRSAYLYMVVDFFGVLENEVHIGFSTAFEADDDWSKTMIHGIDVLVARSPAHFITDIQRVQAVFRPELADLTDVIVFSSKGDKPLAGKLSGGDYDGDLAWVCWDSRIIDNFQNAPTQEQPDLSQYLFKDEETFRDLIKKNDLRLSRAIKAMMAKSFAFNLSKSMLGSCTIYKEYLCYAENSVSSDHARTLSTLLSNLVDQAKQGIWFTPESWKRLRSDMKVPARLEKPLYKQDHWPLKDFPSHIDFLKFSVAKPTVECELKSFHAELNDTGAHYWDPDLASFYKTWQEDEPTANENERSLKDLKDDIKAVQKLWSGCGEEASFAERVSLVYPAWQGIQPRHTSTKKTRRLLHKGGFSDWELLKASTAFHMYCNAGTAVKYGRQPRFVWQMACSQLCMIKTLVVAERGSQGAASAPRVVIPPMYAALRPDAKYVKQVTARQEGGSQFDLGDDDVREMGLED